MKKEQKHTKDMSSKHIEKDDHMMSQSKMNEQHKQANHPKKKRK